MQTQKTLLDQMITFFLSAFQFPGLDWKLILIAVALGLVFGLVWLLGYWPSLKRSRSLIIVGVISAFLTWTAIAFIQIPLQSWSGQACSTFGIRPPYPKWLLAAGIPEFYSAASFQEGCQTGTGGLLLAGQQPQSGRQNRPTRWGNFRGGFWYL